MCRDKVRACVIRSIRHVSSVRLSLFFTCVCLLVHPLVCLLVHPLVCLLVHPVVFLLVDVPLWAPLRSHRVAPLGGRDVADGHDDDEAKRPSLLMLSMSEMEAAASRVCV